MGAPTSVVDTLVSLSKRRGFVYPCSEIYGGQRSAWDYGPLGTALKGFLIQLGANSTRHHHLLGSLQDRLGYPVSMQQRLRELANYSSPGLIDDIPV